MMNKQSVLLLRFSAIFAVVGAFLGSHMAGAGSHAFRPIHAHVLVVGWLSLFAFSIFYKVFKIKATKLATAHVWSSIIGSVGLSVGMWFQVLNPFRLADGFVLLFYIVGGSILILSFVLFLILTFNVSDPAQ